VRKDDVIGVYEYATGQSREEVDDILRQFSLHGSDRLDFTEFGMLMLRLRPQRAQELFLFATTGESAHRAPRRPPLRPELQRIADTFGESLLYPYMGKRTDMLRPSDERTLRGELIFFLHPLSDSSKRLKRISFLLFRNI